jgi:gamma-glutamyltranspeptidase/glutathione hydrolase
VWQPDFTLQVVEPHLNGPGGDAPIIVHDRRLGKTQVICGQGRRRRLTIYYCRSLGLDLIPGTAFSRRAFPAPSTR